MKPKPINIKPIQQDTLQSKKMSIETPLGTIESDSGNHYVDLASIIIIIIVFFIGRKYASK